MAKKPPKKKAAPKGGKKTPAKKADPIEFVVVVNNPTGRQQRLSEDVRNTQFVQVALDGKGDKQLIGQLVDDPGRVDVIDIPEPTEMPSANMLLTPGKIRALLPKDLRSPGVQGVQLVMEAIKHLREEGGTPDPRLPKLFLYWDDAKQRSELAMRDEDFIYFTVIPPWDGVNRLHRKGKVSTTIGPKRLEALEALREALAPSAKRTCWLDAQMLRRTIMDAGFTDHVEHKLVIELVSDIARTARTERSQHHDNLLASLEFQPKLSPPATSGQPPTINLADLAKVLGDEDSLDRVRELHPTTATSEALSLCKSYVIRAIQVST